MPSFSPISRRIRHVQRYVEILEVFARYGFADLTHELRLDALLERGRSMISRRPRANIERLTRAERVRKALEELGPTFIKMGQVMSTRPDLIPQEWADEFRKLQDDVPALDFAIISAQLEVNFPGRVNEVFKTIEKEPLAAASMAQAHRATLHDGTRVVIKSLRPGIRELTATDMEILHTLAEFSESHFANLGYSPVEVISEFAKELIREVDLTHEGRATDRLRGYFENDEGVVFPKVYWEATTKSILTIDEIQGILLSRLKDDDISPEERRLVVQNGARAVFRQCLEIGYFHADPHPGNLFALPGGAIGFIDCGMTGQLDSRTTQQLADLVAGVVNGDLDQVITVIAVLGDVDAEKLEERSFRSDVQSIISQFYNTPLDRLDFGRLLKDFFAKLRVHHVRCPADLILLIKALTTIESVAHRLDPDFELIPFVQPYIENLVKQRYTFSAVKHRVRRGMLGYAELIEVLPREVRGLLSQLRRNKLAVNLEHRGLNRLTRAVEHASRNISFALIIAAMLVGSAILVHAAKNPGLSGLSAIGIAGFVAAAVLVVVMVVSNRRFRGD